MEAKEAIDEETSEFGKGLTYCIGLFLMHAERPRHDPTHKVFADIDNENLEWEMWFNAAADHLYELNTPRGLFKRLPKKLAQRIETWSSKCFGWRLAWDGRERATKDDFDWAVEEAKSILMAIDKKIGAEVLEGDFE